MNLLAPLVPVAQAGADAAPAPLLDLSWGVWAVAGAYLVLVAVGLLADGVLATVWAGRSGRWERYAGAIPLRAWSGRDASPLLALLGAFYIAGAFLQPPEENTAWVVSQGLLLQLGGLAFVVYSLRRRRLSWADAFGLRWRGFARHAATGVVFYLAAMPFLAFYSIIYQLFLRSIGFEILPQEVAVVFAREPSFWMRLYFLSLAVVVAPVFEEVLFRGIGLPLLARRLGLIPGVLALSAIFALVHGNVASLAPLFVIAVAFSLGYIYSGSLAVPIVMHAAFNAVNLVLLMVMSEV